jgi:hypothetical protein
VAGAPAGGAVTGAATGAGAAAAGQPAGATAGPDDGPYDVVFYNKWGSVTHHTFATKAEAEKFAAEFRHGVWSTEDGTLKKIEINRVGGAGGRKDPKTAEAPKAKSAAKELGWLSKKEEVGKRGPETVSRGSFTGKVRGTFPDYGGKSYGTYQMASKDPKGGVPTVQQFVNRYYPKEFKGLTPGSAEFSVRWKEVVGRDQAGFLRNEHEFIEQTHYLPAARGLKEKTGVDAATRSETFRNVVWSTSVQHGRAVQYMAEAVDGLGDWTPQQLADPKVVTDEMLIRAIYQRRKEVFRATNPGKNDSRYDREMKEALKALAEEKKTAAPAAGGS